MAKQTTRRRTPPKRTLIGPLAMLAGGMGVGLLLWHFLMLEPPAPGWHGERLSQQDRAALDRLLK